MLTKINQLIDKEHVIDYRLIAVELVAVNISVISHDFC